MYISIMHVSMMHISYMRDLTSPTHDKGSLCVAQCIVGDNGDSRDGGPSSLCLCVFVCVFVCGRVRRGGGEGPVT